MSLPQTSFQYVRPQGSTDKLILQEVQVPKPGPKEVLVKVHAISLRVSRMAICSSRKTLVACYDTAGEIVAIGEGVEGWKVNDRVCGHFLAGHNHGPATAEELGSYFGGPVDGVLAQYRTLPAHSVIAIPEHLSYEEASTVPCAAVTAHNALTGDVPVKAGDFVLVLGTGDVCLFAIQFAAAAGANVIASCSSDEKLEMAGRLGARYLINYKKSPDWVKDVNEITKGAGVDHVVEVGGGAVPRCIQAIKLGHGQIHVIENITAGGHDTVEFPLIGKIAKLRDVLIGSPADLQDMNRLFVAQPDLTRPVVHQVFPFDKAVDAYNYLESNSHVGKVVIKVA
ncbi:hypothetical protein CVT26_002587 [Gymnopilus dilepis]|uniref:Enoyl reductase (ER) domain-containing protein n=1 Tax=Gymnopilus dilepis TaxID=231916 RepID=A0A409VF41_9AGAR|nr:hypothetical protein CVT26_002587 [Gymnopilus dilepis]